ncbi:MAG: hypothetical protein AABZ67_00190 [Pseudomonadota bacterium]
MKRVAALIVLASLQGVTGPSFAAEPLGRLFFTPAQRAQLDTARGQKSRATLSSEEEATPLPETVTYSGMVRRNDGKSTVWLNNRAINDRQPTEGVPAVGRVRPDGRIVLDTPQGGLNVELKVGQSVEIVSGTIEEPFARRATVPRPESKTKSKPGESPDTKTPPRPGRSDERDNATEPASGAPAPSPGNPGNIRKGG